MDAMPLVLIPEKLNIYEQARIDRVVNKYGCAQGITNVSRISKAALFIKHHRGF